MNNDLKTKLMHAGSTEKIAALLKEAGMDETLAERFWKELTHKREADGRELSLDELEAVTGGADRDWVTDGCAATVEPGSWCGSNDSCVVVDVTYVHEPIRYACDMCGGKTYYLSGGRRIHYKCTVCGYEGEYSTE